MSRIRRRAAIAGSAAFSFAPAIVRAQNKYDPGVTDKEIKLGHTNPYSGPLSAYGVIGKGITAYWNMVNDQGGTFRRRSVGERAAPSATSSQPVGRSTRCRDVRAIRHACCGTPCDGRW